LSHPENNRLDFFQLDPVHGMGKKVGEIDSSHPTHWAVSPDGSLIAATNPGSFPRQLLTLNLADSSQRMLPLADWDVRDLGWSSDSRFVFGIGLRQPNSYIVKIALDGKTQIIFDRGEDTYMFAPHVAPDGRHLYFTKMMWESNAWLLENF
jgi:tricorn protease-like protein